MYDVQVSWKNFTVVIFNKYFFTNLPLKKIEKLTKTLIEGKKQLSTVFKRVYLKIIFKK